MREVRDVKQRAESVAQPTCQGPHLVLSCRAIYIYIFSAGRCLQQCRGLRIKDHQGSAALPMQASQAAMHCEESLTKISQLSSTQRGSLPIRVDLLCKQGVLAFSVELASRVAHVHKRRLPPLKPRVIFSVACILRLWPSPKLFKCIQVLLGA